MDSLMSWVPWLWLGGLGIVLAILLFFYYRTRNQGNDLHFIGVPPGVIPAVPTPFGLVKDEPPVTVAFSPPQGINPAQAAVVLGGVIDTDNLLLATIVDLSVRGYLGIDQPPNSDDPWAWTPILRPDAPPPQSLRPMEDAAMRAIFAESGNSPAGRVPRRMTPSVHRFEESARAATVPFFRRPVPSLHTVRAQQQGHSMGWSTIRRYIIPAILAFIFFPGLGGAIAVVGIVTVASRRADSTAWAGRPGRTPVGRALYEQTRGFREFLATAEAERLEWEQGRDIFSEYLPWAMALGVAERWTLTFENLAAQGRYVPTTTWYRRRDAVSAVSGLRRELGEQRRRTSHPVLESQWAGGRPIKSSPQRPAKTTGSAGRPGQRMRGDGGGPARRGRSLDGGTSAGKSTWSRPSSGSSASKSRSTSFGSKSRSTSFGSKSRSTSFGSKSRSLGGKTRFKR